MSRRFRWLWLVALAVLISACSVDATVTVTVHSDGSGRVQADADLDAEAVQAATVGGATLDDRVRLSDLPEAGWKVGPWVVHDDGSASLRLTKRFTSVDQVPGILEELDGANGPLQEATFTRTRSFFSTRYSANARLDLGAVSTGIADDPDLVSRLQAQGVDVAGVDQQLLGELQRAFTVRLVVKLPGRAPVRVEPAPGAAARLDASSSVHDTTRIVLVAVAIGLVILALLVLFWPRRRRRPTVEILRATVSSGPGTPPTRRGGPRVG